MKPITSYEKDEIIESSKTKLIQSIENVEKLKLSKQELKEELKNQKQNGVSKEQIRDIKISIGYINFKLITKLFSTKVNERKVKKLLR